MEKEGKGAKFVYYALIYTFIALYICVATVSTLHAVTFFELANNLTLAIFLGVAFEIGQATVLFSLLMTKNKHKIMSWMMMFLLTTLQITANVFASFKFMDQSGTTDWTYWQRSILFWLDADSPEIFKVTIAWITGALLPIVALGMIALVGDNLKLQHEKVDLDYDEEDYEDYDDWDEDEDENEEKVIVPENLKKAAENFDMALDGSKSIAFDKEYTLVGDSRKEAKIDYKFDDLPKNRKPDFSKQTKIDPLVEEKTLDEAIGEQGGSGFEELKNLDEIEPVNKERGWHFKTEYIDNIGNVFKKGKYSHSIASSKKA